MGQRGKNRLIPTNAITSLQSTGKMEFAGTIIDCCFLVLNTLPHATKLRCRPLTSYCFLEKNITTSTDARVL